MRNESETDANNYEGNNNERKHAIWKTKEADWPVEKQKFRRRETATTLQRHPN